MAIEGQIQALLGALVSGRCYPIVNTSTDIVSPYITFQVVAATPEVTLSGPSGTENMRVQVDVWAETFGGSKLLASQVKAAMQTASFVNVPVMSQDRYEEVTQEYRVSMDYSIWSQ